MRDRAAIHSRSSAGSVSSRRLPNGAAPSLALSAMAMRRSSIGLIDVTGMSLRGDTFVLLLARHAPVWVQAEVRSFAKRARFHANERRAAADSPRAAIGPC